MPSIRYLFERNPGLRVEIGSEAAVETLYAMALLYLRIVKPLVGSAEFSDLVFATSNAQDIKIGTETFSKEHFDTIRHIAAWFNGFFYRTHLSPSVFDFVDVNDFLSKVRRHGRLFRSQGLS